MSEPNLGADTTSDTSDDYYDGGAGADLFTGRSTKVDRFIVETAENERAADKVGNGDFTGQDKVVVDVDDAKKTSITAANFTAETGLRFEQVTRSTVDGNFHDAHIIWDATDEVVMILNHATDDFNSYAFDFSDFEFI